MADEVRMAGFGARRRQLGIKRRRLGTAILAAAACCALTASGAPAFLKTTLADLSLRLEDRVQTRAPGPAARIALGPHGRDVRLAGEIGEGTAARLGTLLAAHPEVTRIHLTSEGGLVDEALAVGELIAARNLATYVPDYCVSACTLAFVRGSTRSLVAQGRLGFHAPYDAGLFGQILQAEGSVELAAYVAAGVEPAFAAEALAVPSETLWIPEAARLIQARVATEIVETDRFPDSTLDDDPSPAGARAAVLRALPLLEALDGRGTILADMANAYLDGYRAGRPEGEALDALRDRAQAEIARVLRGADDATWVEIGRTLLRAMRRAEPEACRAIGGEGNLLLAQDALSTGSGGRPDDAPRALLARAAGQGGGASSPARSAARPPRDCAGLIAAYARALAGPEAGAALRALASHPPRPAQEATALPR
jgi:hypothetical protein